MIEETPNNKIQVLIVTGTRAEFGLLEPVMVEALKSPFLEPKFLVTGIHTLSTFGNTQEEIKIKGFPIAHTVTINESDDMTTALAKEITGINEYLKNNKTDLVVVLGDRPEPLAASIAAAYLKIPVAHINGGDVSGQGIDEFNRHAITRFSHFHFVSCAANKKRVSALGEEKWRIFNVGATGLDSLQKVNYLNLEELSLKYNLDTSQPWFLVLHHPTPLDQTPFEDQIKPILKATSKFNAEIFIIYPNSDTGHEIFTREIENYANKPKFQIHKSLTRADYLSILKNFNVLIGNSSSGIIESSYYKIPTINIGNRQNGRACGINVINVDYDEKKIEKAIKKAISKEFTILAKNAESPYGGGEVSKKIIRVIEKFAQDIKNNKDKIFFKNSPNVNKDNYV